MDNTDIILIEDNLHDAEMILDAFKEHNMVFTAKVLNDGAKALDYFFEPPESTHEPSFQHPNLILLDLKLPKVSGIEVLRNLKSDKRTQHIPIVVFTSSNEYQDKLKCYSLGVNSYIVKPVESDAFSSVVSQIGSYWVLNNRTLHNAF